MTWLAEFSQAARANLWSQEVRSALPREVARIFSARIPYRFLGEAHPIVDLPASRERRFAACADAAAAILASAVLNGINASACIEAPRSLPTYTHIRVILDDRPRPVALDPYARFRADVAASCEWVWDARDVIEGRLRLLPAVAA